MHGGEQGQVLLSVEVICEKMLCVGLNMSVLAFTDGRHELHYVVLNRVFGGAFILSRGLHVRLRAGASVAWHTPVLAFPRLVTHFSLKQPATVNTIPALV